MLLVWTKILFSFSIKKQKKQNNFKADSEAKQSLILMKIYLFE